MVVEVIGDGIKKSLKGSAKESNKITGADIDEKITGGNLSDTLLAGAGNDVVKAQGGNDYIEGGKGNDKLYGVSGDNKFSFAVGDGKDTIFAGKGSDTVELKSVNASKLELVSTDSKNVILKYSDSDDITLNKYYSKNSVKKVIVNGTTTTWENFINDYAKYGNIVLTGNGKGKVNGTKFDDYISASEEGVTNNKITGGKGNDTIFGNSGNDTIKGGVGNDVIYGGKGDDMLYGEKDNNTFFFANGDGRDTITSGKGIDTIKFDGVAGDVVFEQGTGKNAKDLIIKYNEGKDSITIKKYFIIKKGEIAGVKSSVQNIEAFGKTYSIETSAMQLKTKETETLTINMNYRGSNNAETIVGTKYADTIFGGGGNDLIKGDAGNDSLKGDAGNDTIYGGAGNDTINGGEGNDSIIGGTGNDKLYGVSGNNLFTFNKGDGSDTIYSGTGNDTIYINNNNTWYDQYKEGNDLIIHYNRDDWDNDKITLKDYFKSGVTHSVQHVNDQQNYNYEIKQQWVNIDGSGTINGTKYTDQIVGSDNADTITAGKIDDWGYDYIRPEGGNDAIYLQENGTVYIDIINGDGNDNIMHAANAKEVTLWHSSEATVYGYQNGNNYVLVREYYSNGELKTEKTTIKDFKLSEHPDIIKVDKGGVTSDLGAYDIGEFNPAASSVVHVDKTTRTLEDTSNRNLFVLGTSSADTISTGTGNDTIAASDGSNSITSAGGNNRITAGSGNDTITVNGSGDNYIGVSGGYNQINVNSSGNNTINGGQYSDTININDGVNTVISDSGRDVINVNGGSTTIDATDTNENYIQNSVTAGKVTVMGAYETSQSVYTRVNGDSDLISITGSDMREDVYITSGAKNKVDLKGGQDKVAIEGGDNNRVLMGSGNDSVSIYGGVNYVSAGADDDYIWMANNPSTSTIIGDNGNDTIDVDSYIDGTNSVTIYGGKTDGTDSGKNSVTIRSGSAEIHAGNKGDYIYAAGYSNVVGIDVYGGAGNDTIYGSNNDDYIRGGAGNDTIYSYGGADTIDSGAGNDSIVANSSGGQTFVFHKGDGNDTLGELYYTGDHDTISFADSNLNELIVNTDGDSITIRYNNGADSVELYNVAYYSSTSIASTVDKIVTADNPSGIDISTLVNTRSVYDMNDTAIFTPDTETGGVYFEGSKFSDYIIGTDNNDTVQGYWTPNSNGDDTIETGAGDDFIRMHYGNNTIIGGEGNDTIIMTNYSDEGTNTAIFSTGDGLDRIEGLSEKAILKFDTSSINNISISSIYDVYNDDGYGNVRTLIKYNDVETDGVILNTPYLDYNDMQTQIGLISGGGTQTIYDLLNDSHVYLARSTNYRTLLNNMNDYSDYYLTYYADYSDNTDDSPYLLSTDGNDYIYTAGWSNTIEGGKGNDTIEAIGRVDENGVNQSVGYIDYVINVDSEGNGDGVDTILYDKSDGYNTILVKGVGTDVDDRAAQQAFIDSLRCSFDGDDLIVEYGNDNSKLIFKNAKSDLSGISTNEIKFVYPDETGKYNLNDNHSGYWTLSSNLFIPVNMTSGTPYTASEYYSERINGTNSNDTITLNGQNKIITPKKGADVIKIKSAENNGEYILNMGSDNVADTIWFEDITNKNDIRVERVYAYDENGNAMHDTEGHHIYTNDLVIRETNNWNAKVILKDYFTYAQVEHVPTFFRQIKIGDGSASNTFRLSEWYTSNEIYNSENLPTVNGSVFNDYIYTASGVSEVVNAGGSKDTIQNQTYIYDYDTGTYFYPDPGADTVHGGTGNDSITYSNHDNSGVELWGDAGNDTISFSAGVARGGKGSDSISVESFYNYNNYTSHYNDVTIFGYEYGDDAEDDGTDKDTLRGGDGNDHIYGSKGHDSIEGYGGNDYIDGGAGNDIIEGGSGLDTIYGNDDDDVIFSSEKPWDYASYETYDEYAYNNYHGSSGDALIHGGDGNDTIIAQGSNHTIAGGEGDDLIVTGGYYDSSVNELHFSSGDGHDTVYGSLWSSSDRYNDIIFFDDIDLDSDDIEAQFDEENNQMVLYYDKDWVYDTWGSSITIKDYIRVDYTNPADYTYLSHLRSSIDKVTDQYGNVLSIRDMIEWNMGTVTTSQGTFFSDTATLSTDINYFEGYYGSDSITGNDDNNRLFGYDDSYYFGVEGDGDDYIDGGLGANEIYGGWGDDTLVGGGDDQIDTLYGGYGDNRYVINPVYGIKTIAEIHSSSDQDTIALSSGVATSYSKDGDNLLLKYSGPSATNYDDNTIILKDWYLNPRDFSIVIGNGWNGMYSLMNSWAFSNGVEFGTTNTSSAKLYLGTSYDDIMNVAYGTTVSGGQGNDSITVNTSSSATIYGGLGNDTISVPDNMANTVGNLTIYGGEGTDSIYSGNADDVIYTASPSEDYSGFDMVGNISYKDYVDHYREADSNQYDYVWTGAGDNTVFAVGENANIYGASGDDTYHLTLDNRINLRDTSGSNNIILHTFDSYNEYAYIAIDANDDGSLNSNGVMIMNEDAFYYWLDNHGNMNNYDGGYISLKDNTYASTNITGAHYNYNYMDSATIESFINDIAGWLSDYGCSCVSDYMDENDFLREKFIDFNTHGGNDDSGWQYQS